MEAVIIASTAMQAIGAIQSANAQAASYRSQKAASDYNAAVLDQNAGIERSQANAREEAQRREARQILGSQRAAFAQSGTGLSGSAADVMAQSARDAELDALTLRYEGDMRARGLMAEAEGERYQGRVAEMNASNAKTSGYLNAAGSILGGVGSYMGYQENKRMRTETISRMSGSSTGGYRKGAPRG
jgi:hypothetical protein